MRFTIRRKSVLPPRQTTRVSEQRGAAIAEAALALPLLFLLLFAIFGFGLLMSNYQTMVDAAREAARYGTAPEAAAGYALPTPQQVAQRTCAYLTPGVFAGNSSCSKYTAGATLPPSLTSCTDSAFVSATAAEDIYVGRPSTTQPESYTVAGASVPLVQSQIVVGIRKSVTLPVLGYTLKFRTCSSMRSEDN